MTPKVTQSAPPKPPNGAQSRPKGTIGGPFGTLEGSLDRLWVPNGSSWTVLGALWGCLGPPKAPLWRLRMTFGSKLVRESTNLTPILNDFRGLWEGFKEALERSVLGSSPDRRHGRKALKYHSEEERMVS